MLLLNSIDTIFYAPSNMDETTGYNSYPYPGIKDDTEEIVLKTKLPYFFKENSFVNFWLAEDLFDIYETDNSGFIGVDLYVLGKLLFISLKIEEKNFAISYLQFLEIDSYSGYKYLLFFYTVYLISFVFFRILSIFFTI